MSDFTKRVLVVEDDGLLLGVLTDRLSYHYAVDDAIDGEIAWQKLENKTVHLILLDLLIPMINGFELLERIRKHQNTEIAKVPVIIVSNLAGPESVERAKSLGISEFYIKSNSKIEDIVSKVHAILEPEAAVEVKDKA